MALTGQEHFFKIYFLNKRTNEVTSQHKDLTSQHNYLTSEHNYLTSDGRNMPPYISIHTTLYLFFFFTCLGHLKRNFILFTIRNIRKLNYME